MKTTTSSLRGPLAVFLAVSLVLTSPESNAVLLRDDGNKKASINLGRQFNAVGHIPGCTATYLGGDKVITAAHCINGGTAGASFIIGDSISDPTYRRRIIEFATHPAYKKKNSANDIAIITINEEIPIRGMQLSGRRRIGKTGIIVGFGATGDGLSRKPQKKGDSKRAVKNRIDVLVPDDFKPHVNDRGAIYIDFDSPDRESNTLRESFGFKSSSKPNPLEGEASKGDGGAPLISGGYIVGIVSSGFNPIGTDSQYGTIGVIAPLLQGNNINWLRGHGVEVLGRSSNAGTPQNQPSKKTERKRTRSSNASDFNLIFVNEAAITSTLYHGLPMANAVQSAGIRAANVATRDANSRLTRLRARRRTNQTIFSGSHSQATAKLSQFLAFTAEHGIDAAEALGLNDEIELPNGDMIIPSSPFASAAAGAPVPFEITSDDKRWAIYANGNTSVYDQDPIGQSFGFTTEAGSGAIGIEHHPDDRWSIGAAMSYVSSDTNVSGIGDYDTNGWAVSAYASYYHNGLWGDLLYSYGDFDIEASRTAGLGSAAAGETESNTHQIELNLGYNFETRKLVHGPIFGLNFRTGRTDAFTESGAGTANLIYGETNSDSLTTLLGWQTTITHEIGDGVLTTQFRAGWGHEHFDDAEQTSVRLNQSPFFGFDGSSAGGFGITSQAPRPSSDYLMVGLGVDYSTNEAFFIGVDYETRLLWDDASEHFGSIHAGYRW